MCKEKSYMGRDKCHTMSPIEVLAVPNQTNLNSLGKTPPILDFQRRKGQAMNDIATGNGEYSPL